MNVSAGDKEEIDRTVALASNVGKQAANRLVGGLGGKALGGLMGGFGGKKKTLAAALRLINPASGQTLVTGQGESSKTTISIAGLGSVGSNSTATAYGSNKDGALLVEAFIKAFNAVTQQGAAINTMVPPPAPVAASSQR